MEEVKEEQQTQTQTLSLGDIVALIHSTDEFGPIIGIANYTEMMPQVLVRYKAGDRRQVEEWWSVASVRLVQKANVSGDTSDAN